MSEARVFLVTGFPKSGTTWLMRMLDHVPGVTCRGEGRFFSSHLVGVPRLLDALREGLEPWLQYVAVRKRCWIVPDDRIETVDRQNRIREDGFGEVLEDEARLLAGLYVEALLRRTAGPDGALVGDKTPVLSGCELADLRAALPEVPVVFLRRDPFDTIVSLIHHFARSVAGGRPDARFDLMGPADAARARRNIDGGEGRAPLVSSETARRLASAWVDVTRAAERRADLALLRYEDLVAYPATGLRRALDHLGGDADDAAVEAAVEACSREAVAEGDDDALKAHVRDGVPGAGRAALDDAAIEAIEEVLAR